MIFKINMWIIFHPLRAAKILKVCWTNNGQDSDVYLFCELNIVTFSWADVLIQCQGDVEHSCAVDSSSGNHLQTPQRFNFKSYVVCFYITLAALTCLQCLKMHFSRWRKWRVPGSWYMQNDCLLGQQIQRQTPLQIRSDELEVRGVYNILKLKTG